MPLLKKPTTPAPKGEAPAPQQSQSRPAPGGGVKKDVFAQKYAQTDAESGGGYVPPIPGTYNALITEAQGVIDGEKTTAFLECMICDEENNMQGKQCRIYFNFTDDKGNDMQGLPYFKSAMQQLGVAEDFKSWDAMCETLAEIAQQQMWVVIDVKKKGKWTNIYLSSVPENQNEKPAYE